MQVVWFKRDLRVDDHLPLVKAAAEGRCLCLYIFEPEIYQSEEFDSSHFQFVREALHELREHLHELGGQLTVRIGSATDVLDRLHCEQSLDAIWSHEETGNQITFDRDRQVSRWAQQRGIPWHEIPQHAVVRRLKSRDGWSKQRNQFFKDAPITANSIAELCSPAGITPGSFPDAQALGLEPSTKTELQVGGESHAKEALQSFLNERGQDYSSEMSSPVTAWTSCSRLSPYLAWGCISMRRIVHALHERQGQLRELRGSGEPIGNWLKSLRSFESRLSWHCHFMQKLEDEPSIEFENMSRVYDGMREDEFNQSYFDAWCAGQTGYPMVDACMRALHQKSWINFRMRAMLVSFASYHLWLHWRPTAVYLAKHFLDFEPGIHFSQFQMQSGTTGINTVRIYSPIKQVKDQDPSGKFIRRFVPELSGVPDKHIAEPHKMTLEEQSKAGCRVGADYPNPIVEHAVAYKSARDRIYEIRRSDAARKEAQTVVTKHGSRKGGSSRPRPKKSGSRP